MKRVHQSVLIVATILASWFGMQAVHESGHVIGALVTSAEVKQVVLHPLTISRTDLGDNPHPLIVVWAGPAFGVVFPLFLWGLLAACSLPGKGVARFFAGFCLIANGAYIAVGSLDQVGDCKEMLRHGSDPWHLWAFGIVTVPAGFCLWHRLGPEFGLGTANGEVDARVAYGTATILVLLLIVAFLVDGT